MTPLAIHPPGCGCTDCLTGRTRPTDHDRGRDVGVYRVGATASLTVHVHGEVTALGDGTATIGGWTLPTRLGDGKVVRHVSTDPPGTVYTSECNGDCWDSGPAATTRAERVAQDWELAVRRAHDDDAHPLPFPVCEHALCRRASGPW